MLARFSPFSELNLLDSVSWTPAVDVVENKEAISIYTELPGVKSEDVQIAVEDRVLTLRGERKSHEGNYHRNERKYGTFTRQFRLPRDVDTESIEAQMQDGILEVRLPKKAGTGARHIPVRGQA